jgi:hypothetical protein
MQVQQVAQIFSEVVDCVDGQLDSEVYGVWVCGAAQASGPRAHVVRGTIEAYRLEAHEPARVRLGGSGNAV